MAMNSKSRRKIRSKRSKRFLQPGQMVKNYGVCQPGDEKNLTANIMFCSGLEAGEILSTTYWDDNSFYNAKGLWATYYSKGYYHLLTPEDMEPVLADVKTGEYCIMDLGTFKWSKALNLRFEDKTMYPFQLTMALDTVFMLGHDSYTPDLKLVVWSKGLKREVEMDLVFRNVNAELPYPEKYMPRSEIYRGIK